jgi:hypothetical protein
VVIALNKGDGTFMPSQPSLRQFGYLAGNWRVEKHPRFLATMATHADGRRYADIIGFHDAGVYIAFNNGDGTFRDPEPVVAGFGTLAGWRVDRHPRFVADLTGDGTGDIAGFADDGVWVAINNGDGSFQTPKRVIDGFGAAAAAGGWRVDSHPRFVADLNGDGKADVLGFGDAGVWESLNLIVSLGSATVPNVLTEDRTTAQNRITAAGLTVGSVSQVNNCLDPGTVQSQNPSGGAQVQPGTAVDITVSTCTGNGGGGGGGGGGDGNPRQPL